MSLFLDEFAFVKYFKTSFYTDETYCTAVSKNHNSQQLKFVSKSPQNWQK